MTGRKIEEDGVLVYDAQVTVIPEGDDVHEVLGWASLSPKRYSAGGTYLNLKKRYRMDARLLGGPKVLSYQRVR